MPDLSRINPLYRDALLAARDAGFSINRTGEERLLRAYAEMIVRLLTDAGTGEITAERARSMRAEILDALAALARQMDATTAGSVRATLDMVAALHTRTTSHLLSLFAPGAFDVAKVFDRVQAQALAAMVARSGNAELFRTVYRRRIQALVPQIDTFLDAAVARGVGAGRGTMDLARILANDDPRLLSMLDQLPNAPGGALRRALHAGVGQIDFTAYGIDEADVADLKRLLYDARRIQVSETNNALREGNTAAMDASPVVLAATWQRSGRHGSADECDVLATADLYGFGPGMYAPDKWPLAPHPFCSCTQGGPVKFRRPSEWGTPKPDAPPLQVDPGHEDLYAAHSGAWSDRRLETVKGRVRGIVAEIEGQVGPRARRAA